MSTDFSEQNPHTPDTATGQLPGQLPGQLFARLAAISPIDPSREAAARAHLDDLTKPRGSLGQIEDLAATLAVIAGGRTQLCVDPVRIYTLAGDHGVVAEGVASNPPEVTRQMVHNFVHGGAGISALCRVAGIEHLVVDAGCAGDAFADMPGLIRRRIGSGTANIARGPAMTEQACAAALLLGMDLAAEAAAAGVRCLGIGEMGIGNTTPATALFAAILNLPVPTLTGPGAGLNPEGVARKIRVIEQALVVNHDAVAGQTAHAAQTGQTAQIPQTGLAVLAALGGYEIAGMAGIVLGSAAQGLPCLIDGFIAQSAFVAARNLCPAVDGYAIFAHASAEPGSQAILAALGRTPLLDLGLRLGEGTGCALAVPLLRGACAVYNDMATFSAAGVTIPE